MALPLINLVSSVPSFIRVDEPDSSPHISYVIKTYVTIDKSSHESIVHRRYSEFYKFLSSLSSSTELQNIYFPPKTFWAPDRPEDVEERRRHLDEWLHQILRLPSLSNERRKFYIFLGIPPQLIEVYAAVEEKKRNEMMRNAPISSSSSRQLPKHTNSLKEIPVPNPSKIPRMQSYSQPKSSGVPNRSVSPPKPPRNAKKREEDEESSSTNPFDAPSSSSHKTTHPPSSSSSSNISPPPLLSSRPPLQSQQSTNPFDDDLQHF